MSPNNNHGGSRPTMPDSFQAYIQYRRVCGQYVRRSDHDQAKQEALVTVGNLTRTFLDRAADQRRRHHSVLEKKNELIKMLRGKLFAAETKAVVHVSVDTETHETCEYVLRRDHEKSRELAIHEIDVLEKRYQASINDLKDMHELHVSELLHRVSRLESLNQDLSITKDKLLDFEQKQNEQLRKRLGLHEPQKDYHRTYQTNIQRSTVVFNSLLVPAQSPSETLETEPYVVKQCPLLKHSFIDRRILESERQVHHIRNLTAEESEIGFGQTLLIGPNLRITGAIDGLRVFVGGTSHITSFFVVSCNDTKARYIWLSESLSSVQPDLAVTGRLVSNCPFNIATQYLRDHSDEIDDKTQGVIGPRRMDEQDSTSKESEVWCSSGTVYEKLNIASEKDLSAHDQVHVSDIVEISRKDWLTDAHENIKVCSTDLGSSVSQHLESAQIRTSVDAGTAECRRRVSFKDVDSVCGRSTVPAEDSIVEESPSPDSVVDLCESEKRDDESNSVGQNPTSDQELSRRQSNALTGKWAELGIIPRLSVAAVASTATVNRYSKSDVRINQDAIVGAGLREANIGGIEGDARHSR